MNFEFYKYQGTGNDFVVVDNRRMNFPKNDTKSIARLCDRRFGIGADGLLLLENDEKLDFRMVYFNADGKEGSMCGNGGRCIVAFANFLGIVDETASFLAIDGLHRAQIKDGSVSLQMADVDLIRQKPDYFFLNTGSPHHVQMVDGLEDYDVFAEGKKLRYRLYGEKGSNINFVEQKRADSFDVRTYERGVENETLSCGTGVTAVALAMKETQKLIGHTAKINTRGGELQVSFDKSGGKYSNIWLIGPAKQVFKGRIDI